jgi:lactoylglutathione lyase
LKISHVRLLVPNVRECFLFYRDILGLKVLRGNEETPYAEFKTGYINIALEPSIVSEEEPIEVLRKPHEFSANDQVAIIFRVDNVDATYNQLKSRDVEFVKEPHIEFVKEPHDTPEWGYRIAHFRDPAGNLIEINGGVKYTLSETIKDYIKSPIIWISIIIGLLIIPVFWLAFIGISLILE